MDFIQTGLNKFLLSIHLQGDTESYLAMANFPKTGQMIILAWLTF